MNKYNKIIRKNLVNIPGWRTNRKIVVIESDDWGSIRMPSREVYDLLFAKGIPVNNHYFAKNDCLESEDDLAELFNVLSSFKDRKGNHPVITANAVVANPDFNKIRSSKKLKYSYELISQTYDNYPDHKNVLRLWKDSGIGNKMLYPQFHGREHLNVNYWMKVINSGLYAENLAFDNDCLLGINVPGEPVQNFNYMAAFEYDTIEQQKVIEDITRDGLNIFEDLFGMKSKSFVASCAVRGDHLDPVLAENGIDFHQCGQQYNPLGNGKYKIINKFWGQRNSFGQIYWRRNCIFEPSRNQNFNWVDNCLKEMQIAFRWGKPAVINSHRVNFVGGIFKENREISLSKLSDLISRILAKWPDVEFLPSDSLGDIITGKP